MLYAAFNHLYGTHHAKPPLLVAVYLFIIFSLGLLRPMALQNKR